MDLNLAYLISSFLIGSLVIYQEPCFLPYKEIGYLVNGSSYILLAIFLRYISLV